MVEAPPEDAPNGSGIASLADPRLARIGIALGLVFALGVGLQLHGFSLARWHAVIDRSEPEEVLLGTPRYLRADDWLVQLPLAYAQAAHDPPFPVVNENIGAGQNMLLPIEVPVAHAATLFRPTQWGFFLGNDTGTAWLWWSQVLGLFGVWLLVFFLVSEGRLALSAAAAALLVVSPYFQFWSFTKSSIPIAMGLCFVATVGVATARTRRGIALHGLLLGGSGTAFALVLYPPAQVSLAYLYLALSLGWVLASRQRARLRENAGFRWAAVLGAACIAAGGVAIFHAGAHEAIALTRQTEYPGGRVSTGGDAATWHLFTAHLASALFVENWGALANRVEAASFWLAFPAIGAALLLRRSRDRLAIALILFCVGTILYREIGIPELAARLSLLSFVPGNRTILGLGLADLLLVVRFLSVGRGTKPLPAPRALGIAVLWSLAVAAAGLALQRALPELPTAAVAVGSLASGVIVYPLVVRARPALVLGGMAAALATTTLWFNPLARGGAAFLTRNALSEQIRAIDARHGGRSSWLTYGSSDLANVIRTLGIHSIGGNVALPQLGLWKALDPDGAARKVYNRYAHVGFRRPARPGDPPRFRLSSPHGFVVTLDPEGDALRTLGVTHLLVRVRRSSLSYWARFEPLAMLEPDLAIYALPLQPRSR